MKSDGNVVEAENQSATLTFFDLDADDYFIVLHHRNHLGVMSANAVALSSDAPSIYDFTQSASKYRGNEASLLKSNPDVYGMFAGDGDASGQIAQSDRDDVIQNRDATGYESNDYNLSGIVTISDMDFAASNNGKSTNVPEN